LSARVDRGQPELLRVLHVTNRFTPMGGAEKDIENQISAIESEGHTAFIATAQRVEGLDDARVHVLPKRMGMRDCLDGARRVLELASTLRINVLHLANTIDFLGSRALAPMIRAYPMVRTLEDVRPTCLRGARIHPHSNILCERPQGIGCLVGGCVDWRRARFDVEADLRRWIDNRFGLHTMRRTPIVLAAYSEHSKRLLERHGIDGRRVRVIVESCPVPGRLRDDPRPPEPPAEPRTALTVGRLDEAKGQRDMIGIGRMLKERGVKLDIAGKGHLADQMATMIRDHDLEGWVRLLGRPTDEELGRHMERVGMVVTASRVMETFVRTGVEANMAGRPVVAFDLGGNREWLSHGVNGLLVPYGDDAALARAVADLADDPERAAAMGRTGHERLSELYTRPRMTANIISVYRDAIGLWREARG